MIISGARERSDESVGPSVGPKKKDWKRESEGKESQQEDQKCLMKDLGFGMHTRARRKLTDRPTERQRQGQG